MAYINTGFGGFRASWSRDLEYRQVGKNMENGVKTGIASCLVCGLRESPEGPFFGENNCVIMGYHNEEPDFQKLLLGPGGPQTLNLGNLLLSLVHLMLELWISSRVSRKFGPFWGISIKGLGFRIKGLGFRVFNTIMTPKIECNFYGNLSLPSLHPSRICC